MRAEPCLDLVVPPRRGRLEEEVDVVRLAGGRGRQIGNQERYHDSAGEHDA
jgi:hypothetical protein